MAITRQDYVGIGAPDFERRRYQSRRDDNAFIGEIMGSIRNDDRMRGFDPRVEEYMERFAYHTEKYLRMMEQQQLHHLDILKTDCKIKITELKSEIDSLLNEVENLTEKFESMDYYAEEQSREVMS